MGISTKKSYDLFLLDRNKTFGCTTHFGYEGYKIFSDLGGFFNEGKFVLNLLKSRRR